MDSHTPPGHQSGTGQNDWSARNTTKSYIRSIQLPQIGQQAGIINGKGIAARDYQRQIWRTLPARPANDCAARADSLISANRNGLNVVKIPARQQVRST